MTTFKKSISKDLHLQAKDPQIMNHLKKLPVKPSLKLVKLLHLLASVLLIVKLLAHGKRNTSTKKDLLIKSKMSKGHQEKVSMRRA